MRRWLPTLILWLMPVLAYSAPVVVASKNFTESYVLAEVATQLLNARGIEARHQRGLGGTKICFDALRAGEITLYPEYSGTIRTAILDLGDDSELSPALSAIDLEMLSPLGFNNTYVLAMRREIANARGIQAISDLRGQRDFRIALSHEFRARNDGWPALAAHYRLPLATVGIEHGLAYQALAATDIDITDAYSTDGELATADLVLLADDQQFFPAYDAVWLARSDTPAAVRAVLAELANSIDESAMQRMNAAALQKDTTIERVAADFLSARGLTDNSFDNTPPTLWSTLLDNTLRHILLTSVAVALAAIAGLAATVVVQPFPGAARALLSVCSLFQTIPSIALLALMIPLFGIGIIPAMVALFLYALLPIIRASLTAIDAIEPVHRTVAESLGMTDAQQRRYVLIPLAMPHILSGLRTAAVISIGTATLAAFVGAGGLGQPIVTGLALNDTQLILQGAIPAAGLAILTDLAFDALERRLVPAHLRR
ncbi:MAG: glycine betaine ABC transporter substrate-binding protein [Pseudomonadota bacterium]